VTKPSLLDTPAASTVYVSTANCCRCLFS